MIDLMAIPHDIDIRLVPTGDMDARRVPACTTSLVERNTYRQAVRTEVARDFVGFANASMKVLCRHPNEADYVVFNPYRAPAIEARCADWVHMLVLNGELEPAGWAQPPSHQDACDAMDTAVIDADLDSRHGPVFEKMQRLKALADEIAADLQTLPTHAPDSIHTVMVGMRYTPFPNIVQDLPEDTEFLLAREWGNPHDCWSIRVFVQHEGLMIPVGHVRGTETARIAPLMRSGEARGRVRDLHHYRTRHAIPLEIFLSHVPPDPPRHLEAWTEIAERVQSIQHDAGCLELKLTSITP